MLILKSFNNHMCLFFWRLKCSILHWHVYFWCIEHYFFTIILISFDKEILYHPYTLHSIVLYGYDYTLCHTLNILWNTPFFISIVIYSKALLGYALFRLLYHIPWLCVCVCLQYELKELKRKQEEEEEERRRQEELARQAAAPPPQSPEAPADGWVTLVYCIVVYSHSTVFIVSRE